ncbi:hypothetical protein [Novosphingobium sp. AAP93]|jgi:hypothetical protein|uniref:hypothetical protein n=1 Tax=Novosphingobium sp. AAP93 TaxID=1523427 RepID=UPI0012E19F5C|nr:hypothetical protein [Novosphingobium sp. AAP93]
MANKQLRPLLDELATLPKKDRDAVLALLSTSEREQVLAALEHNQPPVNAECAGHSLWMRAILDGQNECVTPAALAALSRDPFVVGPHPGASHTGLFAGELRRAARSGMAGS